MPLSGRVYRRPAQQPTHGILFSGDDRQGRATAWIENAAGGCDLLGMDVHVGGSTEYRAPSKATAGGTPALRLGLRYVRGLREEAAQALVRERMLAPFASIHDLTRRVPQLRKDELNTLAEIGALNAVASTEYLVPRFLRPSHSLGG